MRSNLPTASVLWILSPCAPSRSNVARPVSSACAAIRKALRVDDTSSVIYVRSFIDSGPLEEALHTSLQGPDLVFASLNIFFLFLFSLA